MKISFVLPTSTRAVSGGLKVIYEYANFLAERGHEVTFYYSARTVANKLLKYSSKLHRIVSKRIIQVRPRWFSLNRNIKKISCYELNNKEIEDADIIIATGVKTAFPVAALNKNKGKKYYFIQGFENWNVSDEYVNQTYQLGMRNIVIAKWLEKIVNTVSNEKSFLLCNAINTNVFYETKNVLQRNRHSIAFHYRSAEFKGGKYAIEVVKKLQQKYEDLDVYIVSSEKKPKDIPKQWSYVFRASSDKVAEINNKVRVFLCTSVEEGFGLPGLEAMACGCSLVTTAYAGVFEYAIQEENALLSEVRDVQGLYNNVVRIFEDDELCKKLSRNGMKTALIRSINENGKKLEKIFEQN